MLGCQAFSILYFQRTLQGMMAYITRKIMLAPSILHDARLMAKSQRTDISYTFSYPIITDLHDGCIDT